MMSGMQVSKCGTDHLTDGAMLQMRKQVMGVTQACVTPKIVDLIMAMPSFPDAPRPLHPASHPADGVTLTLAPTGPRGPLSPFKPIGP